MSYTISQQVTLALIPKFSGGLGIISSLFLMSEIIRDTKKDNTNPIKRLLFFVTIWELLDALGWFLSTWMTPDTTNAIWSSSGNMNTCNFQGFLLQIAVGGPLANSAMAYMFFIAAKGSWNASAIQAFEEHTYCIISLYAAGTAILYLFLEQYNPTNQVCWLGGSPLGCEDSIFLDSDIPCERGHNAHWYGLISFYLLLWVSFIFVIVTNIRIRNVLEKQELNDDAKWITEQAWLYGTAFVLTWIPSTLWFTLPLFGKFFFIFDVLAAVFEPLQAFWNLLIFIRNRPESIQRISGVFSATFDCIKGLYVLIVPNVQNVQNSSDNNKTQLQSKEESAI